MCVSLRNALIIQGQGDNVVCEPYGQSRKNSKWAGAINLYKEGHFHTTLVSSQPVFDTAEKATQFMETLVAQVRALDLSQQRDKISQTLGAENMGAVSKVVEAAG